MFGKVDTFGDQNSTAIACRVVIGKSWSPVGVAVLCCGPAF